MAGIGKARLQTSYLKTEENKNVGRHRPNKGKAIPLQA
jgi:hypothetical protein